MGYRLTGLCCVKEVATNSLTTGGQVVCVLRPQWFLGEIEI